MQINQIFVNMYIVILNWASNISKYLRIASNHLNKSDIITNRSWIVIIFYQFTSSHSHIIDNNFNTESKYCLNINIKLLFNLFFRQHRQLSYHYIRVRNKLDLIILHILLGKLRKWNEITGRISLNSLSYQNLKSMLK